MALNAAGLTLTASTLQANLLFAQLHTDTAGDGTANLSSVGRQPVAWTTAGTTFGLASPVKYVSGVADEVVYSVTLWDDETDGSCFGEFVLDGDGAFNSEGEFLITAIDFTATATDADES